MYGYVATSSPQASEAAMPYILTYPEKSSEPELTYFVLELLFEGGLEILFGLLELIF
jgi:hypothetical protein